MKSEHRHELAENDLRRVINRTADRIEPHTNKLLVGLLVLTVASVAVILFVRSRGASSQVGLAELAAAKTADDFDAVARDFEGKPIATWARVRAGEKYLDEGLRLSMSDRAASNERLDEAQAAFEKVLQADATPAPAREKALYGLAVARETQSGADTGPAIEAYEQLLKEFPDSRYKKLAEERIETLKSPEAQQFYAWYAEQNPKPDDRPLPRDFPFSSSDDDPLEMPVTDAVRGPAIPAPSTGDDPAATTDAGPPPPPSAAPAARGNTEEAATDTTPAETPVPEAAPPATPPADSAPGDAPPGDTPPPTDAQPDPAPTP